jgi:membrane protein DedA with SNARE-associated domain
VICGPAFFNCYTAQESMSAPKQASRKIPIARWTIAALCMLAFILIPFGLAGGRLETLSLGLTAQGQPEPALALAVVLLLAADIVLPVPSSLVSAAAGLKLGFWYGWAASTLGLCAGCIIGYAIGRFGGRGLLKRLVDADDLARASDVFQSRGLWAVLLLRPVPVLAEASVISAGIALVPAGQFLLLTTLANACLSVLYCAPGLLSGRAAVVLSSVVVAVSGALAIRSFLGRRRV